MNVTQDAISKSNKDWDIPVMTRAMKRAAEENPIFIFNVGPMRWTCSGNRIIQACPEGAKYSPMKMGWMWLATWWAWVHSSRRATI
jgi:hypothetical protein